VSGLWASEAIPVGLQRLAAAEEAIQALEKNGGEDESAQMLFLRKENQRLGHSHRRVEASRRIQARGAPDDPKCR